MSGGGNGEARDGLDPRWRVPAAAASHRVRRLHPRLAAMPAYAELHCLSDFSFQRGASSAQELFERARDLGYSALAITDECSLAGTVRALKAAEDSGVRSIVGSEFVLDDGLCFVLLCQTRAGYSALSKLITRARRAAPKGEYRLSRADLLAQARDAADAIAFDGLLALWIPREESRWREQAGWMHALFTQRLWIAVERHCLAGEDARVARLVTLARTLDVPLVASGDVHMHVRRRRALQDAMTAIRLGRPVSDCGQALFPNGERHLRSRDALARLYPAEWLAESVSIAERCTFTMREVEYEYPAELVPPGHTLASHLRVLTERGAQARWPGGVPPHARELIEKELALIAELGYEAFFLTVEDMVRWARSRNILCQGRGSAANSIVCYCLGITSVGPDRLHMLFERFLSRERDEPPDIDVDFEHERREEVIQYVYAKYGRERAALAATVIAYRGRSAARDVASALGFPQDRIEEFSQCYRYGFGTPLHERLRERGFDPDAPDVKRVTTLVGELYGKPRHLSQHVGGFVISDRPLWDLVPVENASMPERSVIQWDKDDLEYLGLLKVDCLALGMLTCLRKCFDLLHRHGGPTLGLADVPEDDPATYAMIRRADTIGVFQIESRAQMSMLPRLRPENYYHLVIQIAIVRPGPIEGGMVNPYLEGRAREREAQARAATSPMRIDSEAASVPPATDFMAMGAVENEAHRKVRNILARTCGVPIFQEQVMALLQAAADFTPGDADQLRRSMAAWKHKGGLEHFEQKIFAGMAKNGFSDDYAQRIYRQILGFGSYGFPESHAASFGLLAYVSSWLKCRYPAVFACALLNSLPMGFYGPAQIVADLRRHGREVRPPDVTCSDWDHRLERTVSKVHPDHDEALARVVADAIPPCSPLPPPGSPQTSLKAFECDGGLSLRLGLRSVAGLGEEVGQRIVAARHVAAFRDVADLVRRARLDARSRDALASAGALQRLAGHRHRAYWDIAGIDQRDDVLRDASFDETRPVLRPPTVQEDMLADYAALGLTLGKHPLQLLRARLSARHSVRSDRLATLAPGSTVRFAGIVTLRQHPEAAKGVTFMTLEDELGLVNILVWERVARAQRRAMLESRLLSVYGKVERKEGVQHLVAERLSNWNDLLGGLHVESRDFH